MGSAHWPLRNSPDVPSDHLPCDNQNANISQSNLDASNMDAQDIQALIEENARLRELVIQLSALLMKNVVDRN